MKSKLFQKGIEETFLKDVTLVDRFPKKNFEELLEVVNKSSRPGFLPSNENLLPLSQSSGINVKDLIRIVRFVLFLRYAIKNNNDNLDDIIADIIDSKTLEKDRINGFKEKIEATKGIADRTEKEAKINSVANQTFPTLDGFTTRCSTVTIIEPEYEILKDDPQKYKPTTLQSVPVVILKFDIDEFGKTRHVSFALQSWELDDLIKGLHLVKTQMGFLDSRLTKGGNNA